MGKRRSVEIEAGPAVSPLYGRRGRMDRVADDEYVPDEEQIARVRRQNLAALGVDYRTLRRQTVQ